MEHESASAGPFLTVLIPVGTAGTQALRESLLCMVGQDDVDFEVVLVAGAAASPEDVAGIEEVISDQPPRMTSRLRLVETRATTPGGVRNAGLSGAAGRYVTVLPDGDLALGSWVKTFHDAEPTSDGRILRALGVTQGHSVVAVAGRRAIRAEGAPRSDSPPVFSLWGHALEPHSPAASWAWPRAIEHDHGVRYDTTVTDDPDRELLVRAAELVGVTDLGVVTSVHRTWAAADTRPAGPAAQDVIDNRPLLLPAGEVRRVRAGLSVDAARRVLEDELARTSEELRLTHDHAANLEAIVRSLEAGAEENARRHAKEVGRLRRKLESRGGQVPSEGEPVARKDGPGRFWRSRTRGPDTPR